MGCTKCKTETCSGCGEQALSINDICNPIECPASECPESFNANCTFYMGENIVCDNVVIVPQGTSMAQAIANMSAYFCSQMGNQYIAGDNIQITIDDDGNSVINTNRPLLRKLVLTGAFPDADNLGITIPRATLAACGIPTDACNGVVTAFSDFLIQGYWFNPDISEWIKFTELDKTTINVNTTGDVIIVSTLTPSPLNYPVNWRLTIIG